MKTTYQICLVVSDTERSTLGDYWGSEYGRFDNVADAGCVLAKLQKTYPGTKWKIHELPETYWSATLKKWVTSSRVAPM